MEKTYERWGTQTMSQNYKIVERLKDWPASTDGRDMLDAGTVAGMMAEAASLIQELGEALTPFVTQRDGSLCRLDHTKHFPDGTLAERAVTLGDIRRARAILSKLKEA